VPEGIGSDEYLEAIAILTTFFEKELNKIHNTPGKRWSPEEIHRMREERGPLPLFREDEETSNEKTREDP
jgi:hypothetical protein